MRIGASYTLMSIAVVLCAAAYLMPAIACRIALEVVSHKGGIKAQNGSKKHEEDSQGLVLGGMQGTEEQPPDAGGGGELALVSGAWNIPYHRHPPAYYSLEEQELVESTTYDFAPDSGEDSWFISDSGPIVGIADGVSGWHARFGIDSGIYSRRLMKSAHKLASLYSGHYQKQPVELLNHAYAKATTNGQVAGAACVVIAALDAKDEVLRAAIVGDSGFVVLRSLGNPVKGDAKLEDQAIGGAPWQLVDPQGRLPEPRNTLERLFKKMFSKARHPKDADEVVVERIQVGDVIVFGTDGLWDNLEGDLDVEEVVWRALASKSSNQTSPRVLEGIAEQLATMAKENKKKPDDITVVVSRVARFKTAVTSPRSPRSPLSPRSPK